MEEGDSRGVVVQETERTGERGAREAGLTLDALGGLFREFLVDYWSGPKGHALSELQARSRRSAAANLAKATRVWHAGADLTDLVLDGFLPHLDTEENRARGAWISGTPAITKDVRTKFEGAGWVRREDWPVVARRIFEFVRACTSHPETLRERCEAMAAFSPVKAFHSGTLSPFLSAIRPDAFVVVNAKSLRLFNAHSGVARGLGIREYPDANLSGRELLAAAEEIFAPARHGDVPTCDLLDGFAHWLWSVRQWWPDVAFEGELVEYWKIAPGDEAELWDEWRSAGHASIGWSELGDLTGVTRQEFTRRVEEAVRTYSERRARGMEQVWRFAHIPPGAVIVANRGTTALLGIGRVTGPYSYVPGAAQGHRLPVDWFDTSPRPVDRPGWRRTLIRLKAAEIEPLLSSTSSTPVAPAGAFTRQAFELLETLDADPRAEIYGGHEVEFSEFVETPVRRLLERVASLLPSSMTEVLETREHLFGEIPKDDHGRGGAWPFYGGALYPKGGDRAEEIQLFVKLRPQGLLYGLAFGPYAKGRHEALSVGLGSLGAEEIDRLERAVRSAGLRPQAAAALDMGEEIGSLAEWRDVRSGGIRGLLPAPELVVMPMEEAARRVRDGFVALFTFVRLALGVPEERRPVYGIDALAGETGFSREDLETWLRVLRATRQVVLHGPPGTGKTFLARRLALALTDGTRGIRETIQLHPGYTYDDFIQGYRPETGENGLVYRLQPGRFLEFCRRAAAVDGAPCVLVVDEINRPDLAAVLGELMLLLEYRDVEMRLAAGGEPFRIPENVHLVGTMSTADRSIPRIDQALRRRFAFIRLRPEYRILEERLEAAGAPAGSLVTVLRTINAAIGDPDFELGISYFLRPGIRTRIKDVWEHEIEPALEEIFRDRRQEVEPWRWATLAAGELRDWV